MAKKQKPTCSFCGRPADMSAMLVPSAVADGTFICTECIEHIHEALEEYSDKNADRTEAPSMDKVPKPREIFEFLNQYVIGQEDAKKYNPCQLCR